MPTTLLCRLFGCNKPGGPHYYLALLQPLDSNAKGITLTLISTTFLQLIWINIEEILNEAKYWRQRLDTGIRKASIFNGLPHILELLTCFPRDIMHQPVITGDKDPYTQWAHGEYIVGMSGPLCHLVHSLQTERYSSEDTLYQILKPEGNTYPSL